MKDLVHDLLMQSNPWLKDDGHTIVKQKKYIQRQATDMLLQPEWDDRWTILTGPRQVGKTSLGKYLAQTLIQQQRFSQLLYINCDLAPLREWLASPLFISEAIDTFNCLKPIVFIDEVQRLSSPGLLLKSIADLHLPVKLLASGSSQLELKSKVQEHLTGRQLSITLLPFSWQELGDYTTNYVRFGCYPAITQTRQQPLLLQQLYDDYIRKDIIEILQIRQPPVIERLLSLMANSSGQLVNYQQLAIDCGVNAKTIKSYLDILEQTFVLKKLTPFVGNKRKEITSNPVYYFIDNGFRNIALQNLAPLDTRSDLGLLIESSVLQELLKYKLHNFHYFDLYYWRTQSGAEIDFIIKQHEIIIPIEVKHRSFTTNTLTRAMHSFIDAYQPKHAFVITKDYNTVHISNHCEVHFISLRNLNNMLAILDPLLA